MPTTLALALASLQNNPSTATPAALLALYTPLAGYPSTLHPSHTAPPTSATTAAADALKAFEHALEKAPAASDAVAKLRREYWSEKLRAGGVPCACCGCAICVTDAAGNVREEKLRAVLDDMFAKEGAPVGWNPASAKEQEQGSPRRRVKKVRRVRRPRSEDAGSDTSSGSGSAVLSYDPYAPSTSAHCL